MSYDQKKEFELRDIIYFHILIILAYVPIYIVGIFIRRFLVPKSIEEAVANFIIILPGAIFLLKKYRLKISDIRITQYNYDMAILCGIILAVINYFGIPPSKPHGIYNVEILLPKDGIFFMIVYLVIEIISIPILEEIIYRFSIYNIIKNKLNIFFGYTITALLFTLIHAPNSYYVFSIVFVNSIILTYLYEKTKNIISPIIAHSVSNLIVFAFTYSAIYF